MISRPLAPSALPLTLAALLAACTVTSHDTKPAALGKPARSRDLLAQIDQPGPLTLETVVSADWAIDRSGLINLEHPRAQKAGLSDGDEPIQLYFHVIRHPTRGVFIVDTGVENALRDAPDRAVLSGMAASAMHSDRMKVHMPLGAWLKTEQVKLAGVLLTHLHVDHVLGVPDVPADTPIYIGPGESQQRAFMNVVVQGLTDKLFAGKRPLEELRFAKDADGRFAGVVDLLGDGTLFAIHTPGHTPGSLAYIARTVSGPVLMTGDTCHTSWGWQHDVEPGSFTADHEENAASLHALRQLAKEHPTLTVLLGHQRLSHASGGHDQAARAL